MRADCDEIKQALKDCVEDWCRRLLPRGRRDGRLWVSHNPVTGDAADHPKDPTFKVALDRDASAWIDYRSGDKGDVIRLAEYVLGTDFRGARAGGGRGGALGGRAAPVDRAAAGVRRQPP